MSKTQKVFVQGSWTAVEFYNAVKQKGETF